MSIVTPADARLQQGKYQFITPSYLMDHEVLIFIHSTAQWLEISDAGNDERSYVPNDATRQLTSKGGNNYIAYITYTAPSTHPARY